MMTKRQRNQHFGKLAAGLFDWSCVNLKREDWDFSKCNPEQQERCLNYECRRDVIFWRQQPDGLGLDEFFPKNPWLKIPLPVRDSVIDSRTYVGRLGEVQAEVLKDRNGKLWSRKVEASKINPGHVVSYHALMVNWNWSKPTLKRLFGDWLDDMQDEIKKRGIVIEPHKHKPQRGKTRKEILKIIGARRLVLAYGVDKACKVTEHALGEPLCGYESSAWWRAKADADDYLRAIYLHNV